MIHQEVRPRDEILEDLRSVERPLHVPTFLIGTRVTAQRRERVRTQGEEAGSRETTHHILYVGVQPPVLMDD